MQFLREVKDFETVYDVYLKKVVHHVDDALARTLPPHGANGLHRYRKKPKPAHRELIRKLFKIPKPYQVSNPSSNNDSDGNSNNDSDGSDHVVVAADDIDDAEAARACAGGRTDGYLKWSLKEVRVLKCGTLKGLARALTTHDTGDLEPSIAHVLLATYRSFAGAEDLLGCVVERYKELKEDSVVNNFKRANALKSLKMVLLMWLRLYPSDFTPRSPTANEKQAGDCCPANESKPLKILTEFLEANADDDVNVDRQLVGGCRSLLTNQNGACPRSRLRLSCNLATYNRVSSEERLVLQELNCHDRTGVSSVTDFKRFSSDAVAELLTRMDADLFLDVVLHECLGSIWGRRNKHTKSTSSGSSSSPASPSTSTSSTLSSSSSSSGSVQATIEQFNAVVFRVLTCVLDESLTQPERVRVIERWIGVAQECRRLKNFSSLKAILSALQSSSIHRLTDTWSDVDRSYMSAFNNLEVLMSDVDNHKLCRDVLEKEGTGKSKTAEVILRSKKKHLHAVKLRIHKSAENLSSSTPELVSMKPSTSPEVLEESRSEGTVPFLGTFLTDLMMIDTAHKDYVDLDDVCDSDCKVDRSARSGSGGGGFVNFAKKQKEWEVLVRMEILQKAASLYRVQPDHGVYDWLESLPVYRESDYYKMSLAIHPKATSPSSSSTSSRRARATADAAVATTPLSSSSSLMSSLNFSSVLSLDSLSSSSSSSSSSVSSAASSLSLSSPFRHAHRISAMDDSGVVLLRVVNKGTL